MILTDKHIEAIKRAAASIQFGSITIEAGTGTHLDLIIHQRIRLPKELDVCLTATKGRGTR